MISFNKQTIFIQIPKCVGSSIENALMDDSSILRSNSYPHTFKVACPLNHLTLLDIEKSKIMNVDQIKKMFKFAVVRNPWDRLISEYIYLKPRMELTKTFRDEIKNLANYADLGIYGNHCLAQHYFIRGETVSVDFVAKFENLQEDFDKVCDKIGIPRQKLPHTNKSNHKHYTEYYDEETREIVAEKYAKDIEYFGYEFGQDR